MYSSAARHTAVQYQEAPKHRCNDFCRTECSFCEQWLCRDQDLYEVIRVGDGGDFIRRCEACTLNHGRGEMEVSA